MKKSVITPLIIFFLIAVVLFSLSIATIYIDGARVRSGFEPKLTVKVISDDGNKITYWGLGYKVVRYPSVSPKEPFDSSLGVKMGSWFMDYTLPEAEPIEVELFLEKRKITVTDRKDVEFVSSLLNDSKYIGEVCKGVKTHGITLNGETHYIKSYCKGIQKGNAEAEMTSDDLAIFLEIVDKYK